jgi:hypothetical protein
LKRCSHLGLPRESKTAEKIWTATLLGAGAKGPPMGIPDVSDEDNMTHGKKTQNRADSQTDKN